MQPITELDSRYSSPDRDPTDGSWQYEVRDSAFTHEANEAIGFRVAPAKVLSFNKGTGAASRHRVAR